ncbi:MAG: acyl-CoA dehydratase activase-related protein [Christensenellales bacterium]|jgi:predicted nucleotide-binding protein (sugar kinase/HSP70/actin superfamily)
MLTFPHIGNIYIFVKVLLDTLNVDYIIPPPCSKKTLELGIKYAPEMVCLPLKINLGNFIESIELGADTIIITAGSGPCRFSYYCEMHRETLKLLGYKDVNVVAIDNSEGIRELVRRLKSVFNNRSLISIYGAMTKAYKAIRKMDDLDRLCYKLRAREIKQGETDRIMSTLYNDILKTEGYKGVMRVLDDKERLLRNISIDKEYKPIRIGLVGDIYTLIEPSSNMYIEKMLGSMRVEVDKSLFITKWIEEHIMKFKINRKHKKQFDKAVEPYLNNSIGGHCRESLGNSVLYSDGGCDGVIQIYPLTCMPEIVASSILPTVSSDHNIPVMTLIIDEMTGEAGYRTRVDAFKDILLRRRQIYG